jgi:hypothetical protein
MSTTITLTELAIQAYIAYGNCHAWKDSKGFSIPPWGSLNEAHQQSWIAVVSAVISDVETNIGSHPADSENAIRAEIVTQAKTFYPIQTIGD